MINTMEFWIVLCMIVFVMLVVSGMFKPSASANPDARLSRIEAKLDLLLKDRGQVFDPYKDVPPAISGAIERGEKILAIKLYRDLTGAGLREAKERIEEIQRRSEAAL